jgi:hypothetical protein
MALGLAHRKFRFTAANETPLGTVIAAPTPEQRELFCRNGLKWFSKIQARNIRAALKEIEKQRKVLTPFLQHSGRAQPPYRAENGGLETARPTLISVQELDLAARMAAQSCQFMLWQQAVAAGRISKAKKMARVGIHALHELEKDFNTYWPMRNKATPRHCSTFLRWRIDDYRRGLM